jgi:methionine-gamma-lyase
LLWLISLPYIYWRGLKHIKLAVSLGGTESLAEHPATMTHADVPFEEKESYKITSKMVRLSIGIENANDIIHDIEKALEKVKVIEEAKLNMEIA